MISHWKLPNLMAQKTGIYEWKTWENPMDFLWPWDHRLKTLPFKGMIFSENPKLKTTTTQGCFRKNAGCVPEHTSNLYIKNPQEDLAKTKVSTQLLRDLGIKRAKRINHGSSFRQGHSCICLTPPKFNNSPLIFMVGSRKTILSFLLSFFRELFSTFCC